MKWLIAIMAAAILFAPAIGDASDTVELSFKASNCAFYRGSWSDDDFIRWSENLVRADCVLKHNVGAACKVYGTNTADNPWAEQRYGGVFQQLENGNFKIELENIKNDAMVLQLFCRRNGKCEVFRLFNKNNYLGVQCVAK